MIPSGTALDPTHLIELLGIGLIAGGTGGLFGIGGGLVMIPSMILILGDRYGPGSFHLYKLAALATAIVLSLPAIRQHIRVHAVVGSMLKGIVPLGIGGVLGGVAIASLFADEDTHVLARLFGAMMIIVVLATLWQQIRREQSNVTDTPLERTPGWLLSGVVVGMPSGLASGLLGIGGGVWAVPVQHYGLGLRLPNAIANSSCMIAGLAAAASVIQSVSISQMPDLNVMDGWWLALWLAPGALIGGWLGARFTHRLPVGILRNAFQVLLLVAGARLLFFD